MNKRTTLALLACFLTLMVALPAMAARPNFGDTIVNTVTVDYDDALGNAMPQESDSVTITVLQVYGVDVAPASEAKSGCNDEDVVYQFTVTNTGNGSDTFDLTNAHQSGWNAVGGVTFYSDAGLSVQITDVTLAANATSGTIYAKVTIPAWAAGLAGTDAVDRLTATSQGDNSQTDYDEVTTTIDAADLSTSTKTADGTNYAIGDTVTYFIYVENTGNLDAANLTVTDTLPDIFDDPGLTTSHGSFSGHALTYNHGTLAAGANFTITITGVVRAAIADGARVNTANIQYDSCNTLDVTHTPQVSINIVSADLSTSTKVADQATYEAGDTVTYTITLINSSNYEATNVVVTDTIPAQVESLSSSVGGFVGQDFTYNHGTLAANSSFAFTITGTVVGGLTTQTTVNNTGQVTYDSGTVSKGPEPTTTATFDVLVPTLSVTKVANTATAAPGDTITYTVTVENTGGADARSVVISDTLSGYVTFVPASFSGVSNCSPSEAAGVITGNATFGGYPADVIPAGGTMTFSYDVTVDTTP